MHLIFNPHYGIEPKCGLRKLGGSCPGSVSGNTLYSMTRRGNGAGASELPHIVMELNAP